MEVGHSLGAGAGADPDPGADPGAGADPELDLRSQGRNLQDKLNVNATLLSI